MLKQSPTRMKKVLVILLVVFFVASLTAVTAVAARHSEHHDGGHHGHGHHKDVHHGKHGGHSGHHHGGHHLHNLHDHKHHGNHDHYYGGVYYGDYEWVYNPDTLMWDWTYMPGIVVEQPVVEQPVEVVTTPEIGDYGTYPYSDYEQLHKGGYEQPHNEFHK